MLLSFLFLGDLMDDFNFYCDADYCYRQLGKLEEQEDIFKRFFNKMFGEDPSEEDMRIFQEVVASKEKGF